MKALYLRIYATVLAVLLTFALVTGWLARHHIEREREQMRGVWAERAAGFAALIGNSLPGAQAPQPDQERALLGWSQRLHLPLALDDTMGRALAASPELRQLDPATRQAQLTRTTLPDGRVLWVGRPQPLRGDPRGAAGPPPRHDGWRSLLGPWGPLFHGPNPALNLLVTMAALFVAVAVAALPLVRSLTRRLEALKHGVERFGQGQLHHRVPVEGRDEVAAVAASFNDAAQRIEDLVQSHRSLLANASHELRSPLARLKMALTLMDGAAPERRATLRDEVEHDIRELDALIDEVLLSSRLDARPELPRDPIDVMALAVEEAARVDAQLDVSPEAAEAPLRGEERLVRRALRNLLENAQRYGVPAAGDTAAIELHIALQGPSGSTGKTCVRFAVSDRGPGVAPDQRERIFEPFYRVPGHGEQAGGVGLGLALVKQIAERHGGTVRCEARPGGGSRFVLSLPLA